MSKKGIGAGIVLGIGLLAIYLGRKYSAGNKLQFFPSSVSYSGKKVSEFRLIFSMDVVNPSFTSLKVNNIFCNIYDQKNQLGRISVTTPQIIPANSTTTLNLPIQLNYGAVIYFLYEVIAKGKKSIKVSGTINSEGIEVPIDLDVPIL
jgi:LEA14-like dessication related protein